MRLFDVNNGGQLKLIIANHTDEFKANNKINARKRNNRILQHKETVRLCCRQRKPRNTNHVKSKAPYFFRSHPIQKDEQTLFRLFLLSHDFSLFRCDYRFSFLPPHFPLSLNLFFHPLPLPFFTLEIFFSIHISIIIFIIIISCSLHSIFCLLRLFVSNAINPIPFRVTQKHRATHRNVCVFLRLLFIPNNRLELLIN